MNKDFNDGVSACEKIVSESAKLLRSAAKDGSIIAGRVAVLFESLSNEFNSLKLNAITTDTVNRDIGDASK